MPSECQTESPDLGPKCMLRLSEEENSSQRVLIQSTKCMMILLADDNNSHKVNYDMIK